MSEQTKSQKQPEDRAPVVLIAGATSASGVACAKALIDAGAKVLAVGSNADRLVERMPRAAMRYQCDLTDHAAVEHLRDTIHDQHGKIDVLLHLVGGWRGGKSIAGQSDEDWYFLHDSVLTTLRNTTRLFVDDLVASPAGRLAIISSESVMNPTPSNANYGAVKAAAEHWVNAVARLFTKQAEQSAAFSWVVKALSDKSPDEAPAGYTPVSYLGEAAVQLLKPEAAKLNGTRVALPKA
ncbi:oxidoreductase [Glutamicibacter uratoxydans]|uniref:Oxidoreductase n=1 Tax=Glutamicibacter uratoxydans TaxID=43667 RepID=A0A4Y4DS87_GLUUR|nr:SDR family oxidoreductase [Glutamicibacter uratoxydans]GED07497.1 oxidoreductase [Glutamicibacter uratoxydans]